LGELRHSWSQTSLLITGLGRRGLSGHNAVVRSRVRGIKRRRGRREAGGGRRRRRDCNELRRTELCGDGCGAPRFAGCDRPSFSSLLQKLRSLWWSLRSVQAPLVSEKRRERDGKGPRGISYISKLIFSGVFLKKTESLTALIRTFPTATPSAYSIQQRLTAPLCLLWVPRRHLAREFRTTINQS